MKKIFSRKNNEAPASASASTPTAKEQASVPPSTTASGSVTEAASANAGDNKPVGEPVKTTTATRQQDNQFKGTPLSQLFNQPRHIHDWERK